jgi:tetratricopeptide (TPR) repeat protein
VNLSWLWKNVVSAGLPGQNPTEKRRPGATNEHWREGFNAELPSAVVSKQLVRHRWLQLALAGLLLVSCKTVLPPSSHDTPPPPLPEDRPPPPPEDRAPPPLQVPDEKAALNRRQAAAALTDRGRSLMAEGQVDPAMRLFEQALSLAPRYGPGYFYLADAWLLKNNWLQAREFHRQAVLYLPAETAWQRRVDTQRRRIDLAAGSGTP